MAKYDAFGTTLTRTGGAAIAQVENFSGPSLSLDTEDVTSHDSPGGWEEVVGTILRSGEMTLDIVYDPVHATHANAGTGLLADMISRTAHEYTLTFPDAGSTDWVFDAFVTGFETSAPHDGKLSASVTMKLTGEPTIA